MSDNTSSTGNVSRLFLARDWHNNPTQGVALGWYVLAPQRVALGFDSREATPGFKRQLIILNAETRSFKRVVIVMKQVVGLDVSTNTIERISIEAGISKGWHKQISKGPSSL